MKASNCSDSTFLSWPHYDGEDLGAVLDGSIARFRLWSPEAEEVRLNIYANGDATEPSDVIEMMRSANGTWVTAIDNPILPIFYTFQIKVNGNWLKETPGPWAKAAGTNGLKAALIDLSKTNPSGWENDKGPHIEAITDAVIYEMHHRDMSVSPSSGIINKGKFLALTESGTHNNYGDATGLNHLKELGITHVHILPSYDFNSVDESRPDSAQYNWGYDPFNYNVPEGSYSTDASRPEVRIREMKEMIKSLHDNGIGVVMDVVYNHTSLNDDSNFSLTAPGYYYRHRNDGSYSDASGCGNETASERRQMQDFIVNSVKYWAKEYHIDGFRFDLMAIHDIETMNRVVSELKQINPDLFVYGEGWTAGDSPLPVSRRALKENVASMPGVAVFSDDIRDAIKGHYTDAADRGFATGKPGLEETVKIGIVGATPHPQVDYSKGANSKFAYASAPTQIINYVSCHDDLTLTDKLKKSMIADNESDADRRRAARLAQTIVMTSQGTPFIFAGEEVWRDKKGVHNSYKSPDSINAIDWDNKHLYAEQFDYYRELIKLRKKHPAFRLRTAREVADHIVFEPTVDDNLIVYRLIDNAGGDSWEEIIIAFNGSDFAKEINVKKGNWLIVADDGKIQADGMGSSKGGKVTVAPRSALILAKE